jgi:pyridoxal phosphate enzyme (YggS family)
VTAVVDVAANLAAVRARIAAAAARVGRDAAEVLLIAVSKTKPAELVQAAVDAGVRDIGENYVQEALAKQPAIRGEVRWHLIGPLQRNKAARALEAFELIHSVGGVALAERLAQHAARRGHRARVLVEVNVGGEASKHGVAPHELPALLERLRDPFLSVEGLMTVPPPGSPQDARRYFRQLRALRDSAGLRELSMGMTDDFEIAIEEGATMVRVGRAIFGARPEGRTTDEHI